MPSGRYLSAIPTEDSGMVKTSVAAKGSFKISFTVDKPGAVIR